MARGIDVNNVQYVISYESPPFIKTYIHRIGRTARAGREGTALTMLDNKEVPNHIILSHLELYVNVFHSFNAYSAEIFPYKPWRPKVFFSMKAPLIMGLVSLNFCNYFNERIDF